MIQLLAFVQSLERDFISRAKGISVSYGSSNKLWEDVVTALGMPKPRKRKFIANDGRAPDTTDELLSAEKTIKKKRNGPGRPLGSQNFNRNPLTTYQSYSAGTTKGHFNRCWQTSTLESLYALLGPLWSEKNHVNSKSLVAILMRHFTQRLKAEITQADHIKNVLTRGQNLLHDCLSSIAPGSFKFDAFASADGFMEHLVTSNELRHLFSINFTNTKVCPVNRGHNQVMTSPRQVLRITTTMFQHSALSYADIGLLIHEWFTNGLEYSTGLVCRKCHPHPSTPPNNLNYLEKRTQMSLTKPMDAPLHLYFLIEGLAGMKREERETFQADQVWPAQFYLDKVSYHLISWGFWCDNHYWYKVLKIHQGILGVWFFDERQNAGIAQLISTDLNSLAGAQEKTSWLCYSRIPFQDEQKTIHSSIRDLMKAFPDHHHSIPFSLPTVSAPYGGGLPSCDKFQMPMEDIDKPHIDNIDINQPDINPNNILQPDINNPDINVDKPHIDKPDIEPPNLEKPDIAQSHSEHVQHVDHEVDHAVLHAGSKLDQMEEGRGDSDVDIGYSAADVHTTKFLEDHQVKDALETSENDSQQPKRQLKIKLKIRSTTNELPVADGGTITRQSFYSLSGYHSIAEYPSCFPFPFISGSRDANDCS